MSKTRNRLLSILLTACMVLTMLPAVSQTAAATATSVLVADTDVVNGSETTYWLNSPANDGTITSTGAGADNYNVKFEPASGGGAAKLYLKGADIIDPNPTETYERSYGIQANGALEIVVEEASSVRCAITPKYGNNAGIYVSDSLTISGSARLTVNGINDPSLDVNDYGVRFLGTLTIAEGADLLIQNLNTNGSEVVSSGMSSTLKNHGTLTISSCGAYSTCYGILVGTVENSGTLSVSLGEATISRAIYCDTLTNTGTITAICGPSLYSGYGIYASTSIAANGGTITAYGTTAAMNIAPTSSQARLTVSAGADADGAVPVTDFDENYASYKYARITASTEGVLDLADGPVVISATGYKQGADVTADTAETPYTGSYMITGSYSGSGLSYDGQPASAIRVEGLAAGASFTLNSVSVQPADGEALTLIGKADPIITGAVTLTDISYADDTAITGAGSLSINGGILRSTSAAAGASLSAVLYGDIEWTAPSCGDIRHLESTGGSVTIVGDSQDFTGTAAVLRAAEDLSFTSTLSNPLLSSSATDVSITAGGSLTMTNGGGPAISDTTATLTAQQLTLSIAGVPVTLNAGTGRTLSYEVDGGTPGDSLSGTVSYTWRSHTGADDADGTEITTATTNTYTAAQNGYYSCTVAGGTSGSAKTAIMAVGATVTLVPGEGSGDPADAVVVGGAFTLPEVGTGAGQINFTAPENKTFAGWLVDDNLTAAGESISVSQSVTVTASWKSAPTLYLGSTKLENGDSGAGYSYTYNSETQKGTLTLSGFSNTTYTYIDEHFIGYVGLWTNHDLEIVLAAGTNNTISGKDFTGLPEEQTDNSCGIYSGGALTISGSGSLTVRGRESYDSYGVWTENGLTVTGGQVTLTAVNGNLEDYLYCDALYLDAGGLTVSGGSLTLRNDSTATDQVGALNLHNSNITQSQMQLTGKILVALEDPSVTYEINAEALYKFHPNYTYVKIDAGATPTPAVAGATFYGLWLGGTQVSSLNQSDILGSGGAAPTAVFTPAVTEGDVVTTPAKLTLNNANVTAADNKNSMATSATLYVDGDEAALTVELAEGSANTLTGPSGQTPSYGIDARGSKLTFTGSGTLTAKGGDMAQYAESSCGIYAGSLTIAGPTVTAIGGNITAVKEGRTVSSRGASIYTYDTGLTVTSGEFIAIGGSVPDSGDNYSSGLSFSGDLGDGTSLLVSDSIEGTALKALASGEYLFQFPYAVAYAPAPSTVFYKNTTTALTGSADFIQIPETGSPVVVYSVKRVDQHGAELPLGAVTWEQGGTLPDGVTVIGNGAWVRVTSEAAEGSFTLTAKSGEEEIGTLTVNISNKTDVSSSITFAPGSADYTGSKLSCAEAVFGGTAVGTGSWTYKYAVPQGSNGDLSSDSDSQPVGAGTYTVTATYEDDTQKGEATGTFTVNKVAAPITGVQVTSPATIYDSHRATDVQLTHDKASTISGTLALDAGQTLSTSTTSYTWTFTPTGETEDAENYNAATGSITLSVTADSVSSIDITTAPTKTTYKHGEAFAPAGMVVSAYYASDPSTPVPLDSGDYTISYHSSYNNGFSLAGGADQNVTVTCNGNTSLTDVQSVSVEKADSPDPVDLPVNVKYNASGEQTVDLSDLMANAGDLTYAEGSAGGDSIIGTWSVNSSGTLTYTLASGLTDADAGKTATLSATISSEYYYNALVTVVVTLTDKDAQAELRYTGGVTVVYGETLALSATGGSGGGDITYSVSNVTGEATITGSTLTPTKAGTVTVTATKAGDATYSEISSTPVTININKATPTGSPSYTAITEVGKTLADANLAIGGITPLGGSIAWDDPVTTTVAANTSYGWTYTPADATNYNTLTGSIVPYRVGGGGGGGTVTTPSVSDPVTSGGTTTVTTPVTPTTTGSVSSATVPNSTANQAVDSAIEAAADNNTAPVVEIEINTPARADSIEVTLPAAAVETLAENEDAQLVISSGVADIVLDADAMAAVAEQAGTNFTISVTPVAASELNARQQETVGAAPVFDVTITSGSTVISDLGGGSIAVTIPYELAEGQSAAGLTVYYLDDEGNLHPCETSYANGKLTFITGHLSKYAVLYDETAAWANPFTDLSESDWFYGNVAYACENGLMAGTGATTFDPYGTSTRAMVVTVLWRMADAPLLADHDSGFTDLTQSWYADAVNWASQSGVVEGYGDGLFGPDDPVTREQLAVFLYRYAQQQGGGFEGAWTFPLDAPDADDVSDWAYEAMCWMTMNGIIQGRDDETLDPQGQATRAEFAAMLQRFCETFAE
ncbi:MAG: S-layer homology domain-containing protein [Bacillota bacterium]|nr:S-layer homology domain-containing protein [Bacillota bacterium]